VKTLGGPKSADKEKILWRGRKTDHKTYTACGGLAQSALAFVKSSLRQAYVVTNVVEKDLLLGKGRCGERRNRGSDGTVLSGCPSSRKKSISMENAGGGGDTSQGPLNGSGKYPKHQDTTKPKEKV